MTVIHPLRPNDAQDPQTTRVQPIGCRHQCEAIQTGLRKFLPQCHRDTLGLQQMVEERTLALEKEGLPVTLQCGGALPRIPGDPSEFGLMLDLLLNSFLEERARVEALDVRIAREGPAVVMTIEEQGGTLPGDCDASDLGLLLRRCRHSRAIGIALANHLVHHRFKGEVKLESGEGDSARFLMRIPVGSQRGADV